ncbi:SOS response-associated peptidase [Aliiglaciecola litoralis]|uniref:Abasic site processing protein n=1 Tax=Aliiglaciecola litoralis TaxID=582857 RepID=A0ABN1LIY5_9ALTE
MCGRFANHIGAMHGWSDILGDWPAQAELGFNIAPSQLAPIITSGGTQVYRWGLLPSWVKTAQTTFSTFNARLATLAEKPTFKHAWEHQQRCIVPALGYYEWRQENGFKQAYFVCRKDGSPILFGGLYETPNAGLPGSFTIITRPAEGPLEPLHHAMPLMFDKAQAKHWFANNTQQVEQLAWYTYDDDYRYYPVSSKVNSVANQGAKLVEPTEPESQQQQGFGF